MYTPKTTVEFEKYVSQIAKEHVDRPFVNGETLQVVLMFFLCRGPVSDIDNLAKSVLDGLQRDNAAFSNDKQVKKLHLHIFECEKDEQRTEITIQELIPEEED